jgi:hypothetical protein
LSVIALPVLSFLLLQNNSIQNALAKKISTNLSKTFGSTVTINHVSLDMFNRLIVSGLFVEDWRHDTLLFSKKVTLDIEALNFRKKVINIGKLELDNAYVHLYIDSLRNLNLEYILDRILSTSDSTKEGWDVIFENIGLKNSHFRLEDYDKNQRDSGIYFSDLNLLNLKIRVKNLHTINSGVTFRINKLAFIENSGFVVDNISSNLTIKKNFLHFQSLQIHTPKSDIIAQRIFFDCKHLREMKYFDQKVNLEAEIISSKVSMDDISKFAPTLHGMKETFSVSGSVKGKLCDLRCKQMLFGTGKATIFNGNISITGLPDITSAYMFVDSKNLNIQLSDIENLYIPGIPGNKIVLNEYIRKAGYFNYKGNFTGFVNDFVAYGVIKTGLGTIKTDISLKPSNKKNIAINGSIAAVHFNLGKLLPEGSNLGTTDFTLTANGFIADSNKVSGTFDCRIDNIQFNDIVYNDIIGKGTLNNNLLNGSITIADPNITLLASGQCNFSKKDPSYNIKAELSKTNLSVLNFLPNDSIFNLSCLLDANFKGNSINHFDGIIDIKDLSMNKPGKSLFIKNIQIKTQDNALSKEMQIRSNLADVDIFGEYNVGAIKNELISCFKIFMPGSFPNFVKPKFFGANQFMFNAKIKSTDAIFNFFVPDLRIAANSKVNGLFYPSDTIIRLTFVTNKLRIGTINFDSVNFHLSTKPDSMAVVIQSDNFIFNKNINLQHLRAQFVTRHDSSRIKMHWADSSGFVNKLKILANYIYPVQNKKPYLKIEIQPDKIKILDSIWNLNKFAVLVDSSSIKPMISLQQNKQQISVTGTISENEPDTLTTKLINFDLSLINYILKSDNFKFDGSINGKFQISDYYKSKTLNSNFIIDNFAINKEIFGHTNANITWNKADDIVLVTANASRNELKTLQLVGSYGPTNNKFDFSIAINNIGLNIFQPIVASVFTLQKGLLKGTVLLSGTPDFPELNGTVNVDSAQFKFNLLNTVYSFSNKIEIKNNKFVIKQTKLIDEDKNPMLLWGTVNNNYFKSLGLDIHLVLENNLAINPLPTGNLPFYGKGYASGKVIISGTLDEIKIDVTEARTMKNTVIALPLGQTSDLSRSEYIRFAKKTEIKKDSTPTSNYNVKSTTVLLTIDLEVTPDAEVQLVFDPKVGDLLKSHGAGNLKLEINKTGNFQIWGNYAISSGDYLFTLQNLVNKKFIIQNGATITFNGDPLNATLDIQALYRTKAPLYNLIQEDQYKKRIPVDCRLFINGKLQNPDISFDIDLPNSTEETKNMVRREINNDQAVSQQFISLLLMSNFIPSTGTSPSFSSQTIGKDMATTTSLELLSNQLSNWISQVSDDFNIGLNYRPGDQVYTSQEVELALSTQLLNDRVSINGNLDVVGNKYTTQQNNFIGDVEVEYQVTDKVKLKAFNRSNDMFYYNSDERYTKGFGVVFREDFSSFKDLRDRYFSRKKKKNIQPSDTTQRK